MGWCSATEIMDAALEGAERSVAVAWRMASGMDSARTPALANALRADPTIRESLDDALRPFVARIAERLRDADWDCIQEAKDFDRFRQEMLGYSDHQMIDWYRERLSETDDPAAVREYSRAMAAMMEKVR